MKKLFMILLLVVLPVFSSCNDSKEPKPEAETVARTRVENQTESPAGVETASVTTFTFDTDEVGKMPMHWSNHFTGKGKLGNWEIRQDDGQQVLAQVSQENFGYHFDVIVWDESDYQNLEMTVRFKGVKGKEDQGGGPVWRYHDADNYYIARANPLENNFRVYKVVAGNRKQLASVDLDIPTGEWHTIKISMMGNHILCFYDGKKYHDVTDDTFTGSGKVGLWTKADAFTYFDNLEIIKK